MARRRRHWGEVAHPTGMSREQLERAVKRKPVDGEVTAGELEADVLAFISRRYRGRHLAIEAAQLGLSNVAQKLIVAHLRAAARGGSHGR